MSKKDAPINPPLQQTAVTRSVVWKPSPLIRWKRVEIDKLRYEKVLQQLWQGDMGEQEWRDVPEED